MAFFFLPRLLRIAACFVAGGIGMQTCAIAQDCIASAAQPVISVPGSATTLRCTVANDARDVRIALPGRICHAFEDVEAGTLMRAIQRELPIVFRGSGGGRSLNDVIVAADNALSLSQAAEVDSLDRLLRLANVQTRGLDPGAPPSRQFLPPRAGAATVRFGDCYSRDAMVQFAQSVRESARALTEALNAVSLEMPCGGTAINARSGQRTWTRGGAAEYLATVTGGAEMAPDSVRIDACVRSPVTAGYEWRVAFDSVGVWQIVGSARTAQVVLQASDAAVALARLRNAPLPRLFLGLTLSASHGIPGIGTAPVAVRTGLVNERVRLAPRSAPYPVLGRYWIDDYRLHRGGQIIVNDGVVDPRLMLPAADTDGVVHVEGRNMGSNPSFRLGNAPLEILESRTTGGTQYFKLRTSGFERGSRLEVQVAGEAQWLPLSLNGQETVNPRRRGGMYLDRELLAGLVGDASLQIGAPTPGQASIRLGAGEARTISMPEIRYGGVRLEVRDLRSQPSRLSIIPSDTGTRATVRIEVPFESEGNELVGDYEPTVLYWVCERIRIDKSRCPNGDLDCLLNAAGRDLDALPSCLQRSNWSETREGARTGDRGKIPLTGQINNLLVTLEVDIGIREFALALDGYRVSTAGDFALATNAGDLPAPPDQILAAVRGEISARLSNDPALRQALQDAVAQLNARAGGQARIREIRASTNVIFFDRDM